MLVHTYAYVQFIDLEITGASKNAHMPERMRIKRTHDRNAAWFLKTSQ
jgi:hypothetical protein